MAKYIAKRAVLDTVRECNGSNCGCYANTGYYIQYKNRNVDSLLFVCEECYSLQYRSMCTMGDFKEAEYVRSPHRSPYQHGNPGLRKAAAFMNRGVRAIRMALLLTILLLLTAFFVKEQPPIRAEFPTPEIHTAPREFNELNHRLGRISVQIERIASHGGNEND